MTAEPQSTANAEAIVTRDDVDNVAIVTLNRPNALNSLSLPLLEALKAALDDIAGDTSVRALIIRGAGRGFCAGHDLKEITSHREDEDGGRAFFEALFAACTETMLTIAGLPVAVIAEVHGIATAAGGQLVATCDMAIASNAAKFGVNGVDAGLFCSTPMVAVSRNVPRKAAMEMLTTGAIIDADRAREIGLVNHVVAPEELSEATLAMARRAAQKSRDVVALGKSAFYRQVEMGIVDAYRHMSKVIVDNLMMRDAEIGICAFIEKRQPIWEADQPSTPPLAIDHDNYSDGFVRGILDEVKTIAMVGASAKPTRPSYLVLKYLLAKGYRVLPINPGLAGKEILGQTVYGSLAELPEPVDMVEIFRNSEAAGPITDEALKLQPLPKVIWMQLSVRNDDAAARAQARGVKVVMNRCPKIEYGRLSGEINWTGVNSRTISSKRRKLQHGFQHLGLRDGKRGSE